MLKIVLANLNALGIVALCVLVFIWALRTIKVKWQRQFALGLVFGAGAIVSMLEPIIVAEGYRADGRYLFISLISAFGAGFAAIIATIVAVFARLVIGGPGATFGSGLIVVCAVSAWAWGVATRRTNRRGYGSWILLSLIASLPIAASFFLFFTNTPYPAIVRFAFTTISILVFGKLMEAEKRRAVREVELNKAAGIDFLTQLPNRRALREFLSSPRMEPGQGQAILAIDIDHFKQINDKYGHQTGDEVLRAVGAQLNGEIGDGDFAARTGGEEFVMILRTSSIEESEEKAECIRAGLCLHFTADQAQFTITASLGGVYIRGYGIESEAALAVADKALYEAKRSGRNQSKFLPLTDFD